MSVGPVHWIRDLWISTSMVGIPVVVVVVVVAVSLNVSLLGGSSSVYGWCMHGQVAFSRFSISYFIVCLAFSLLGLFCFLLFVVVCCCGLWVGGHGWFFCFVAYIDSLFSSWCM